MHIILTSGMTIECDYCTNQAAGHWATTATPGPGFDVHHACHRHLPTMQIPA